MCVHVCMLVCTCPHVHTLLSCVCILVCSCPDSGVILCANMFLYTRSVCVVCVYTRFARVCVHSLCVCVDVDDL